MSIILAMDLPVAKDVINDVFSSGGLNNIMRGVQGLAVLALLWFFGKEISKILTGAEQFNPRVFAKPLIYSLIVFNWGFLNTELDKGMEAFTSQFEATIPKEAKGFNKYQIIEKQFRAVADQKLKTKVTNGAIDTAGTIGSVVGIDKETIDNVKDITTSILNPEILLLKGIAFISAIIDACIMFLFNAFSYLWINMLRIGGTLAVTLYLFPVFQRSLSNWLKTYVAVYLWIPSGALILYVCDSIFVKFIMATGTSGASEIALVDGNATAAATKLTIGLIICLALKVILLSKVPTLISYWVGGNSGGVFSSVSAMPTMITNAGKTAGGLAVTAASAGAGAGAAATKSKSLKQ